jgi:hypothetical protein
MCIGGDRTELELYELDGKKVEYTMCPADNATAGSWAGVRLVN